jgi:site-specific DNA recombinase
VETKRAKKEGKAMKTAATYSRVSTEDQEREGTSLQTQLEACLKYCRDKGYNVAYRFSEAYSGLTLERPKLNELRELVRAGDIDVIVVYCLDRLGRDPTHGVILTQELEKHHVILEAVTETVDSSELGKLISYIRGFASKLEAEKIRERTMRGKKARALSGKLPANSHARLYGYRYAPGKGIGEGVRYINEEEARWVREIYRWLVEDGLSTNAITYKLRALGVPTPSGKGFWIRSTVHKILTNPAYCGKTYAFTQTYGEPKSRMKPNTKRKNTGLIWKNRSEWIEIPDATPPIISEELFETAQKRLQRNREISPRNAKIEYLLRGHMHCLRCGKSYWGAPGAKRRGQNRYYYPFYQCSGNVKIESPVRCGNKRYGAKFIENVVWERIATLLSHPELVLIEIHRQRQELKESSLLEKNLERIETQLAHRDKQKQRIWRAFAITGDEESFRRDIALVLQEIKSLEEEKLSLTKQIETAKQCNLDEEAVKRACQLIAGNVNTLTFEDKRLALEALQIKVWIDGDNVTVEGCIPIEEGAIASMPTG